LQFYKKIIFLSNSKREFKVFRESIINYLAANDFKAYIVVPDDKTEPIENIEYIYYKLDRESYNIFKQYSTYLHLKNIINKIKPDLIISYTILPNIFGSLIAKKMNFKIINSITGLGSLFLTNSIFNPFIKYIYKKTLSLSNSIIVLNESDKVFLTNNRFIDINKTILINGEGVDIDFYKPISQIDENSFKFLFIGRLIKEKGIFEYISSANIFLKHQNITNFKFYILGDFDSGNRTALTREEFYKLIEANIHIEYLGYKSDIRDVIANVDCIVLPSYREGLSRVLLEAASMSKPVVTTDVPGCKDVIIDGYNGFLCKPNDQHELFDVLYKMYNTKKEHRITMGENSRKYIIEKFSSEIINKEFHKIINKHISL
jgi:glycosyltransferase involved in cell wall biosynthesis